MSDFEPQELALDKEYYLKLMSRIAQIRILYFEEARVNPAKPSLSAKTKLIKLF